MIHPKEIGMFIDQYFQKKSFVVVKKSTALLDGSIDVWMDGDHYEDLKPMAEGLFDVNQHTYEVLSERLSDGEPVLTMRIVNSNPIA